MKMMDHFNEQSKRNPDDNPSDADEKPRSYYYDDATNYETYSEDDNDDEESSTPDDAAGQVDDCSWRSAS